MKKTLLAAALGAVFISAAATAVTAPSGDTTYDKAVQALANFNAPAGREEALGLLEQSLAEGDGRAGMRLGTLALQSSLQQGDEAYQKAISYFARAADLGAYGAKGMHAQAVAQRGYFIGQQTVAGREILAQAQPLLEEAAKDKDANREVLWHLGYLELTGYGGKKERSSGLEHLQRAAEAGHGLASLWLANHYSTSVPSYPEQELKYLKIAANSGIKTATIRLAAWEQGKSAEEILAGVDAAQKPLASAAIFKNGVLLASASDTLPDDLTGGGVTPSALTFANAGGASTVSSTSANRLTAAQREADQLRSELRRTELQLQDARAALARAEATQVASRTLPPMDSQQVPQGRTLNDEGLQAVMDGNYEVAVLKFREAIKSDYPAALANLGLMYLNGTGVPRDGRQAVSLFERAAKKGNLVAAENIARAYDFGLGVGRNRARAITWYETAQGMGSELAPEAIARLKAD